MSQSSVTRRSALGLLGAGAAASPLLGGTVAAAAPVSPVTGTGSTPVQGLHLQFGKDPARQHAGRPYFRRGTGGRHGRAC